MLFDQRPDASRKRDDFLNLSAPIMQPHPIKLDLQPLLLPFRRRGSAALQDRFCLSVRLRGLFMLAFYYPVLGRFAM